MNRTALIRRGNRTIEKVKARMMEPLWRRNVEVVADRLSETPQNNDQRSPSEADLPLYYVASCLAQLLETARRELDRDREAAKASLDIASQVLQSEIERHSGQTGSGRAALAGWQKVRVRAFIDENLHRNIGTKDLSIVAGRSRSYFSRSFKEAFGEPPHAYVIKRRLQKACHSMVASSDSLSAIALSSGFADQAHLARHFRRVFGQSPSTWRRERMTTGVTSKATVVDEPTRSAH
jgi:AraC-like DNA-binding protein